MELFKPVIILILFIFTESNVAQNEKVIFVKSQEGNESCPGYPCKTLDEYIISASNKTYYSNLTVILLEGHHTRDYKTLNYQKHIKIPEIIQVIGYGLPKRTILKNMKVILSTPKEVLMDGFTVQGSTLSTLTSTEITYRHVKIIRCAFTESTITLSNAELTITDSSFSLSPSTAIILSSSTLTLIGNVRFSYNKGIKEGHSL